VSSAPPRFDAPFTFGAQLEARARHPEIGSRVALQLDDRSWTYRQFRDESVRCAHWLQGRLARAGGPPHVAMLMENHLELMSLYGGCAFAGATLFGVNTGLRGETLAGVLNHSRASVLVVDERLLEPVEAIQGKLEQVSESNILVVPTQSGASLQSGRLLGECLDREVGASGESLEAPRADVSPETNLMVIYTSGTTGLPKGINNNHFKLLAIGMTVAGRLELTPDDCGYACMPLFHSNAMFLGFQPAFHVGGRLAMRERFSASHFVSDVLDYGVTYWNYVGEPDHPGNRLTYAVGNGAAPPDIDRFIDWLGLEDMFELYGSTEAAISTFRRKTDPRGSVGEITDDAVRILREDGSEAEPAELGPDGKIRNYARAVGEICRVAGDTALFQGYFDNRGANDTKYREGVYHSGDLGHILLQDGKRYLYFDGRTDDWIRKDGENFSAAQVARLLSEHDDVVLAAAYGVPCPVSDEWVMAAVKLRPGAVFDPQDYFDFCERQVAQGGMDRKWFPDFVRVVDEFEYTQTQKILVRHLKGAHYDRRRLADEPIYWRERGDTCFRPFTAADYEALRERFRAAEREDLLDR